jgi:hypothetical protein
MIEGMTLRDWFAGKALTGIASLIGDDKQNAELIAEYAYLIAIAMMDEKEIWEKSYKIMAELES